MPLQNKRISRVTVTKFLMLSIRKRDVVSYHKHAELATKIITSNGFNKPDRYMTALRMFLDF
jgi:hypothetical protein